MDLEPPAPVSQIAVIEFHGPHVCAVAFLDFSSFTKQQRNVVVGQRFSDVEVIDSIVQLDQHALVDLELFKYKKNKNIQTTV